MIKMSVMDPNVTGARFDHDYYGDRHMPLVKLRMGDSCMYYPEDKGIASDKRRSGRPIDRMGRNRMRRWPGLVLLCAVSNAALPQQPQGTELPASLEGKWVNNAGAKLYSGRIAFRVDSRAADGSMTGRWTFEGVRCKGSELPATARYDGAQLVISSRIDDGAVCGVQTATFKRTDQSGTHALFEGRLGGDGKVVKGNDVDVFLNPR